jgi:ATP-dependent RNA helicase DHX33
MLRVVQISQAQACQRTGRAGREAKGNCYRMLTRSEFERLDAETVPEIKRCSLANVIIQMLSIGVSDISKFDFLEPPPQDAIEGALRQLELLGGIEVEGSVAKLTDLGKQMAAFPLDPKFTKAIMFAKENGCT